MVSKKKWKYGYEAKNETGLSSFEVMDRIIKKISNQKILPNLKRIILIGHSAGGQFVQRYAVGTQVTQETSIPTYFVVSNPSSYLYLHDSRISFSNDFEQFIPSVNSCSDYNEYLRARGKTHSVSIITY